MEGVSFVCTKDRQASNGNLQDTKLHGRNFVSTFPLRENGCAAPPIPARRMGKDGFLYQIQFRLLQIHVIPERLVSLSNHDPGIFLSRLSGRAR